MPPPPPTGRPTSPTRRVAAQAPGARRAGSGSPAAAGVPAVLGRRSGTNTLHVFETAGGGEWRVPVGNWVEVSLHRGGAGGRRAVCYTVPKGIRTGTSGVTLEDKEAAAAAAAAGAVCEIDEMVGGYLLQPAAAGRYEAVRSEYKTSREPPMLGGRGGLSLAVKPLGKVGWVREVDITLRSDHPKAVRLAQMSLTLLLKGKCVHAGRGEVLVDFFGRETLVFDTANAVVEKDEPQEGAALPTPCTAPKTPPSVASSAGARAPPAGVAALPATRASSGSSGTRPAAARPGLQYGVITMSTLIRFTYDDVGGADTEEESEGSVSDADAGGDSPRPSALEAAAAAAAEEAAGVAVHSQTFHRPTPSDATTRQFVATAEALRARVPGLATANAQELSRFLVEGFFPKTLRGGKSRLTTGSQCMSPLSRTGTTGFPGSPLSASRRFDSDGMDNTASVFHSSLRGGDAQRLKTDGSDRLGVTIHIDPKDEHAFLDEEMSPLKFKSSIRSFRASEWLSDGGEDVHDANGPSLYNEDGCYNPPSHLLVEGPPGSGKSFIAGALLKYVDEKWGVTVETIHVADLVREKLSYGGIAAGGYAVKDVFAKAKEHQRVKYDPFRKFAAPADEASEREVQRRLIVIEGIEHLVDDGAEITRVALCQFARELELITQANLRQPERSRRVLCVATCPSWRDVHPLLRGGTRFASFITTGQLKANQRARVLRYYGVHGMRADTLALAYPAANAGDLKALAAGERPADGFSRDPKVQASVQETFEREVEEREEARQIQAHGGYKLARPPSRGAGGRSPTSPLTPATGGEGRSTTPPPESPVSVRSSTRQCSQPGSPLCPIVPARRVKKRVQVEEGEGGGSTDAADTAPADDDAPPQQPLVRGGGDASGAEETPSSSAAPSAMSYHVTPIDLPLLKGDGAPGEGGQRNGSGSPAVGAGSQPTSPLIAVTPPPEDGGGSFFESGQEDAAGDADAAAAVAAATTGDAGNPPPAWVAEYFRELVGMEDTVNLLWRVVLAPLVRAAGRGGLLVHHDSQRRRTLPQGAGDVPSADGMPADDSPDELWGGAESPLSGGASGGAPAIGGILLHGASGTGKTALAATLVDLLTSRKNAAHGVPTFTKFECTATSIISKVVGQSEGLIAQLFASARANAPSVIVIDQLEALAYRRGSETVSKALDRTLSTLLTELDGVHGKGDPAAPVIVVAATSQKDVLDPAILRSGRLDLHISMPTYDTNAAARLLYDHLASAADEPATLHAAIAQLIPVVGFTTYADVARAADVVKMCALKEAVEEGGVVNPRVTPHHLAQGLAEFG